VKRPWLAPLNPLYAAGVALRNWRIESGREEVKRLQWPVVSVGSLSAGGAGKTPTAIALAKALVAEGFAADVLSRGYGRSSREAVRVRADGTAEEFGDEPLLIARVADVPVFVAAQRYEAGLMAEASPVSGGVTNGLRRVHLLDDGFQHRQLARDVDILLVSRADWRDALLPGGDLREPRSAARRAGVIAIPVDEQDFADELKDWGWSGPLWRLRRVMDLPRVTGSVTAFCGIARAEQFFEGLERAGVRIGARIAFGDHHRYSARDLEMIVTAARKAGATALITTRKDEVRLGTAAGGLRSELPLLTAGLRVEIEHEAIGWLCARLAELTA
jgi:tetraacyldisaccharide 4'-kinase